MNQKYISHELWQRGVPHRIVWGEGGLYLHLRDSWNSFLPLDDASDADFVDFVEKAYKKMMEVERNRIDTTVAPPPRPHGRGEEMKTHGNLHVRLVQSIEIPDDPDAAYRMGYGDARAAEALKPLAHWAEQIYEDQDDDDTKDMWLAIVDLRRAAQVYAALIRELESRLAL